MMKPRLVQLLVGIGSVVGILLLVALPRPSVETAPAGKAQECVETFYANGALQSRSQVSGAVLNGLSEGFYTNGQLQVSEYYVSGVSHGLRTKWYVDGQKKSEAQISDGLIHGLFRRWYPAGSLAEEARFFHGTPEGLSVAYYASGFLKAAVRMKAGQVVDQQFWKESDEKRPPPHNEE